MMRLRRLIEGGSLVGGYMIITSFLVMRSFMHRFLQLISFLLRTFFLAVKVSLAVEVTRRRVIVPILEILGVRIDTGKGSLGTILLRKVSVREKLGAIGVWVRQMRLLR